MNEYGTESKSPTRTADPWLLGQEDNACESDPTARLRIVAAIKSYAVRANAVNVRIHHNPYPAILLGIGAGALLGIVLTGQLFVKRA